MQMSDPEKQVMDVISISTVIGTLTGIFPSLAALFTICWTGIRIWETKTVQKFIRKKRRVTPSKDC